MCRVRTLTARSFAPEAAALRIRLETGADGIAMAIRQLDDEGQNLSEQRLSVEGASPGFTYLDPETGAWLPSWTNENILPGAVRIGDEDGAMAIRILR